MNTMTPFAAQASPLEYEEMSLNAWPALKTDTFKGCLLRSSNGYTNRANSANPLYVDAADIRDVIEYAESFYAAERLPSVFKVLGVPRYEALDGALASRGYERITETSVMRADLSRREAAATSVEVRDSFSEAWVSSCAAFNGSSAAVRETMTRMLGLIRVERIVASIVIDGVIAACGYGTLERGHVGFFDIIVDPALRGRGYGREMMVGIMEEARRRGAHAGYLQVVQSNDVARRLYGTLGFEPYYSYWYRRLKPAE